MRRSRAVVALLRSALLVLALIAAAQPGLGHLPDIGKRRVVAAQPVTSRIAVPFIGKRWS